MTRRRQQSPPAAGDTFRFRSVGEFADGSPSFEGLDVGEVDGDGRIAVASAGPLRAAVTTFADAARYHPRMDVRSWWFVLVASAAGCGPQGPAPVLTPTLPPPEGVEPRSNMQSARTADFVPVMPIVPRQPTPGLSPAVVEALHGLPMYVARINGMALFADEQVQAQEVIAAWAMSAGLTVLPPRRTSEVFARAALGQHVSTGKACGASLAPYQAVHRWRSELAAGGKIEAGVYCDPGCVLQVSLSIGADGEGGSEFFAAPFDAGKPWRDELAVRLPTLADNGGHNQHGHMNNPVAIAGVPRGRAPKGLKDLILGPGQEGRASPKEAAAALRCLDGASSAEVQLAYGARGRVTRCEPTPDGTATAAACICRALSGHTGAAGARERFQVTVHSGTALRTKDGLTINAYASPAMVPDPAAPGRFKPMTTDPAIELWEVPAREVLASCFVDAAPGADAAITARATLDFDRDGKMTQADILVLGGAVSTAQQACLRAAFLRVRSPCPSSVESSASAEVHVGFDRPSPRRSP